MAERITAEKLRILLDNTVNITQPKAFAACAILQNTSPTVARRAGKAIVGTIAFNIEIAGGPIMDRTLNYLMTETKTCQRESKTLEE